MLFLISMLLAVGFAWFCAKPLRLYPIPFYIGAAVVTVLMSVLGHMHVTGFVNDYIIGIFTRGAFATALWCIVAWTGALPNGTAIIKHLMPVRGELSIFAAIVTWSHIATYGFTYLMRIFSDNPNAEFDFVLNCIVSLSLVLIMIPLTVLSFKKIRKMIKPKTWKAIQRIAYVFYAFMFVHAMIILVPRARMGREGAMLSIIVYTIVFAGYAVMRIYKYMTMRRKNISPALIRGVGTACFALVICGMTLFSLPAEKTFTAEKEQENNRPAVTTEAVSETVQTETDASVSKKVTTLTSGKKKSATSKTTVTSVTSTATETTTSETDEEKQDNPQKSNEDDKTSETTASKQKSEDKPKSENKSAPEPEPEPEPEEPQYMYNDGTYHVDVFGYDAYEHFDITISCDCITNISGYCEESDPWYFDSAMSVVSGAIISSNSPYVADAVSGATISSDAIKQAASTALDMARK